MEAANRFRSAEMMSQVVILGTSVKYGGGCSSLQGCIFFPKIEFFINHYLEHRVFYKLGQSRPTAGKA